MNTFRVLTLALLLSGAAAYAQTTPREKTPAATDQAVTVSVSAGGVRFSAPGGAGRMRLEVFGAGPDSLYDSGFQPGNMRDWYLRDRQDQPLPDGAYLCVVTTRGLSGKLSVKQGTIMVQGGQAALQFGVGAEVGAVEPEKSPTVNAPGQTAPAAAADSGGTQSIAVAGTGTTNRLVKWADASGTLMDASSYDINGLTFFGKNVSGQVAPLFSGAEAYHVVEVGADGTKTPLTLAGGSASMEFWKDLGTPSGPPPAAAVAFGLATPGRPATNDMVFSTYTAAPGWNERFRITTAGNVGIGNSAPAQKLDVAGNIKITGAGNGLMFADGSIQTTAGGGGGGGVSGSGTPNTVPLWSGSAALSNSVITQSNGNVGVGTSSPQVKLDVAGDLSVAGNAVVVGNIAAKYQDVAEWVPARQKLAAGTVVVLDSARNNGVAASSRAYDTHVAGVVSAQPGVILGEGGEGKALIATTGRVRVKVDATRHPIRIGDLLVTGDRAGAAMRSMPISVGGARIHRPGTIVGKALEPLAHGTGEILVLLSLQ